MNRITRRTSLLTSDRFLLLRDRFLQSVRYANATKHRAVTRLAMKKLKHVRTGQPITAALMNQLIDGYNQLQGLGVSAPLQMMHLPGGVQIGLNQALPKQSLFEVIDLAGTTPGDGSDPQDVFYWRARQVGFNVDGVYDAGPPEGSHSHILYDPLRVYDSGNLSRWQPAFLNTYTGHWEMTPGFVGGKWAKAVARWVNGNHPYVNCHRCRTMFGDGEDEDAAITIALPKLGGRDPNVREGDVIAYTQVGDGTTQIANLCISNYLDDKVGTIKSYIGTIGSIPPGWALADGVANSVANGGTGQNLTARFLVGYQAAHPNYFQIGNIGGASSHNHSLGSFTGASGLASAAAGYITGDTDHRPPYYTVAFIERIL